MAVKADAERIRANMPPEVTKEEHEMAITMFQAKKCSLSQAMKPSKGFYERMLLQIETAFKVVPFTQVTNALDDDEHNPQPQISVDPQSGAFRSTTKLYSIGMPRDPLSLTARFRIPAVCL